MKSERLDKILAHAGFGTRSEIKQLVKRGLVQVNGKVIKDSGVKVDPAGDSIAVDGEQVVYREFVYVMLNKPQGVISATEDVRDRTVLDLLGDEYRHFSLFPVGRLDKDTEGLLVLTNDGKLAHELLSPKKHVPKTYFAKIKGLVGVADREAFLRGVALEDGYVTMPAELAVLKAEDHAGEGTSDIELTIMEGKFHQVKRMFEAVGKRVTFLKRIKMGNLPLDRTLRPGEYRELTDAELALLKERD